MSAVPCLYIYIYIYIYIICHGFQALPQDSDRGRRPLARRVRGAGVRGFAIYIYIYIYRIRYPGNERRQAGRQAVAAKRAAAAAAEAATLTRACAPRHQPVHRLNFRSKAEIISICWAGAPGRWTDDGPMINGWTRYIVFRIGR
jgi:hypothetical protein